MSNTSVPRDLFELGGSVAHLGVAGSSSSLLPSPSESPGAAGGGASVSRPPARTCTAVDEPTEDGEVLGPEQEGNRGGQKMPVRHHAGRIEATSRSSEHLTSSGL